MIYGSICSGIEAASVAWHPLGWRAAFVSEIEPFPRAVLQERWPATPLHGDFTTIKAGDYEPIDLLVGGTPCQSFSVAGLRGGLDDARGNLALEYGKLARRTGPRWLVWENVPGVLSSNAGRDFASILGLLSGLAITPPAGGWRNAGIVPGIAYGLAWRVLDAQFVRVDGLERAVPQRRRRLFVVGHSGGAWQRAAAVLFERESLSGHPAPRREAGKGTPADVAPGLVASGRGVERTGESRGQDAVVAVTDVSLCLNAGGMGRQDYETETLVAHALRGEGFDASEDGTGRGTPLVPEVAGTMKAMKESGGWPNSADHAAAGYMLPVAFDWQSGFTQSNLGFDPESGITGTLLVKQTPAVAFSITPSNLNKDYNAREAVKAQAVTGSSGTPPSARGGDVAAVDVYNQTLGGEVAGTVTAETGSTNTSGPKVLDGWAVRRLTPRECERLQGFPDDYTLVEYRGKPAADGPRYKALGNSMAVNVMRWIGTRIEAVDKIETLSRNAGSVEG
jgi:DNA (cytosine-5)-methyltransferase 1